MPEFIPGLQLCKLFYEDVVKHILDKHFPKLNYSAALLGYGSDVIGFDTPRSTDHMWGPRLYLFLSEQDFQLSRDEISAIFKNELPYTFKGYSINFSEPDPDDGGVRHPEPINSGPVNPLIWICTVESFFEDYLGCNPSIDITIPTWLTLPEHRLLAVTAGEIFHDDLGLETIRQKFRYYPDDVWYYLLASQWAKIAEEEAFVGRCREVGDEIGARIIATRIVHSLMRLCFLMEKQYAPYSKWFGSAFSRLAISETLSPKLQGVLAAKDWQEREQFLAEAYRIVAKKHNSLRVTPPLSTEITSFYDRPYQVIFASRFTEAIRELIADESLKKIDAKATPRK